MSRARTRRLLTGAILAAGLWLGFPNDFLHVPPLALAWPVGLALLGRQAASLRDAWREGWLASMAGGMAALYWLALPVHRVGGLPWLPAAGCALFIVACITFAGGVFAAACHAWRQRPPFLQALLAGLAWFLLEEAGARLLGFPWLTLGGALAAWPLLTQAADTLGAYGLAGLWTCASLLCCYGLLALRTPQGRRAGVGGLALCLCLLAYGGWRLADIAATEGPRGVDVLFVEGNVDQNQKWLPAFQRLTVERYLSLTERALQARPGTRPLIVWPETALPFFFEQNSQLAPPVRQLAARHGGRLLLGAPAAENGPAGEDVRVFNRAFLLGPDGATLAHYDKEHLVPFGEYLPTWLDWPFLEALLQGVGVYSAGANAAPLRQDGLALGMLICYEGIFPWLAQARVAAGANLLADISNDGWFGLTPAARQHLGLTALRALEQDRWLLRGTNTGISAVIDPRGRVVFAGAQFRAQALWSRAATRDATSAYHALAPWLPPAGGLLFLALLLWGPGGRLWRPRQRPTSTP